MGAQGRYRVCPEFPWLVPELLPCKCLDGPGASARSIERGPWISHTAKRRKKRGEISMMGDSFLI